jgi:hypothetical protein
VCACGHVDAVVVLFNFGTLHKVSGLFFYDDVYCWDFRLHALHLCLFNVQTSHGIFKPSLSLASNIAPF